MRGIRRSQGSVADFSRYAFMQIWYKTFPKSRALPFHIAGESYGGHYIPIFAKHIVDENSKMTKENEVPLKSLMIGNGIFDPLRQAGSGWVSLDLLCIFLFPRLAFLNGP